MILNVRFGKWSGIFSLHFLESNPKDITTLNEGLYILNDDDPNYHRIIRNAYNNDPAILS